VNGSGVSPDDPATIRNISYHNTRKNLTISFTVIDPDSIVSEATVEIERIGVVSALAIDGVFDEKQEEVHIIINISSLALARTHVFNIESNGGSADKSFYIPVHPWRPITETEYGYRELKVHSKFFAATDVNITEVFLQVNGEDTELISITPGNPVWVNTSISADEIRGEAQLLYTVIDSVDSEESTELVTVVHVPILPSIDTESVLQDAHWYNISVPLVGDGLQFTDIWYKIDDGQWENGSIDGSVGRLQINITDMIGTYPAQIKAVNEWDDSVIKDIDIEIDLVPIYKYILGLGSSSKHTRYVEDIILDELDGETQETYDAINTILDNFRVSPRDFAVKLITGLSNNGSSEIQTVNKLYEAFPELANMDVNFTFILLESDHLQKKSDLDGDSFVGDVINTYKNLNDLEKLASVFRPSNRTCQRRLKNPQ